MTIREEIVVATKVNGEMADVPNRKGLTREPMELINRFFNEI
jgi:aryl-alcohol dehydrogenase-like predicted oxidoreductase